MELGGSGKPEDEYLVVTEWKDMDGVSHASPVPVDEQEAEEWNAILSDMGRMVGVKHRRMYRIECWRPFEYRAVPGVSGCST